MLANDYFNPVVVGSEVNKARITNDKDGDMCLLNSESIGRKLIFGEISLILIFRTIFCL